MPQSSKAPYIIRQKQQLLLPLCSSFNALSHKGIPFLLMDVTAKLETQKSRTLSREQTLFLPLRSSFHAIYHKANPFSLLM